MNVRMTEELYKEICAMRKAGATVKKICEETGVSQHTVWKYTTNGAPFQGRYDTLCWDCALSALGDVSPCCWVRKGHLPREDWEAVRRDKPFFGKSVESYFVLSCPGFVEG